MAEVREALEGCIVDLACIRKYPRHERLQRAREHTKQCALMGHCLESGYGLVTEEGQLALLDDHATAQVVDAIRGSSQDHGIKLRVVRQMQNGKMETRNVEAASG